GDPHVADDHDLRVRCARISEAPERARGRPRARCHAGRGPGWLHGHDERRDGEGAMTTKLITIPFSHYCEKARWALDRVGVPYEELGHLPLFHYVATYPRGRQRTVPLLVDGDTIVRDST